MCRCVCRCVLEYVCLCVYRCRCVFACTCVWACISIDAMTEWVVGINPVITSVHMWYNYICIILFIVQSVIVIVFYTEKSELINQCILHSTILFTIVLTEGNSHKCILLILTVIIICIIEKHLKQKLISMKELPLIRYFSQNEYIYI